MVHFRPSYYPVQSYARGNAYSFVESAYLERVCSKVYYYRYYSELILALHMQVLLNLEVVYFMFLGNILPY